MSNKLLTFWVVMLLFIAINYDCKIKKLQKEIDLMVHTDSLHNEINILLQKRTNRLDSLWKKKNFY